MQKIELTWIGKGDEPVVEPRTLLHEVSQDYGDPNADNMLIHGDDLLALKALEQDFTGKVKCIFIDPLCNIGSAIEHHDDNLEHSAWLSLMVPRLRILQNLLSEDGSIWISIDDNEGHYLKVLSDEVFGRNNFINTVICEKRLPLLNNVKWFSDSHDFLLVYAKNKVVWRPNLLPRTDEVDDRYKHPDKEGMTATTLWKHADIGYYQDARKEVAAFNSESVFVTSKPERLIKRILLIGSNEGDIVLDSFLGSGTTAVVALKMGRRYIGIEQGDHCYTHCLPRLKTVVDGEQGGISKAVNWKGGGGFKFYELAPTLTAKDANGEKE